MANVSTVELPPCGLYRTTRPLPGVSDVGAGLLVNFHNHSDQGAPAVHLPVFNAFNRWQWSKEPRYVRQLSWIESLERLPLEGYYVLHEELVFEDGKWPPRSLVQLGYDREANPILFLAQRRFHTAENTLFFGDKGVPIDRTRLAKLETLVVYEEPDPNLSGGEAPKVGGTKTD